MKLPFVFSAALFAALLPRVSAAPISAASQITAVTVYLDRAVVTRSASVAITTVGPVEVTLDKLPATLLDQSLQVSGQGTASATLLDVTPRAAFLDFTPNPRVKILEDDLRTLNQQDRTLADRITILGQQRDYVIKIQNATTTPPKDAATAAPTPEAWLPLLKFSEDQLAKLAAEQQSTETQREELQTKRAALEQELAQLRSQDNRSSKTVVVRLDATSTGSLDLTVRYTVFRAGWTPSYDVRANSSDASVQLGYFGLVNQQTGEDWKNIDLTLSTARPSLGGAAPELQPWIVQQQEIRPLPAATALPTFDANLRAQREAKAMSSRVTGGAGGMLQAQNEGRDVGSVELSYYVAPAAAAVETQATSATFRVAAKTDIPSDQAPHKVSVATFALKADLTYAATPKLLPSAFLTASVANISDYPLLAGAANVFLDDTFVATASLRAVMPGEKFDLALGADDAIAVKRKLNNRFAEDTGLVNKGRRLTYDYTLSVQNNKKAAAKITVVDQVPVSRHEKIVVRVLTPDEKTAKPDADGTLKWNLSLTPGEKRELPLKFSIEYPNDLPVTGLE